jgi:type I restriction enzyme, S subunit
MTMIEEKELTLKKKNQGNHVNPKNHGSENFKKTEVGLIPGEWDVKKISEITSLMTNGFVGTIKSQYTELNNGVLYIQGYNVWENSFNFNGIKRVKKEFHQAHLKSCLQEGDLLTIQTGDIGVTTVVPRELVGSNCHALIITRFKKGKAAPKFYSYYFNSIYGRQRLKEIETGSTMKHINVGHMIDLFIPIPPVEEQTAIAKALSDADALITSLEKLIAKKQNIKQGAMQQLLQPKKGWLEKKLDDYLDYEQPTEYIVTDTEYNDNNQTPVLTAGKSFVLGYTNEEFGIFRNVPVIIFDDFTTATKYVDFHFKVKSSAMKILTPKNADVNLRFVYEIMQRIDYPMGLGDHKRHWIGEYRHIEIKVPLPEEQNRIAHILGDMDKEIEKLHQQLAKYKMVKQGMMQNLLTGKIRLNHD